MDCVKLLLSLLVAFFVSLVLSPLIISLIKKEKIKQVILHYVDNHQAKSGTPTMGGIIFIITICLVPFIFFKTQAFWLSVMVLAVFLGYSLVGFLDDYIKFKFKRNLGLRAYQKILFQLAISIIISVFAYKSSLIGSTLVLPFSGKLIDLGWGIIPFNIFVFLATTNSVNLTDGLDCLATGTSLSYFVGFFAITAILLGSTFASQSGVYFQEIYNLQIIVCVAVGALICYTLFNCYPAKIFMGDTGSLGLGALIASLAVVTRTTLYLPMLGIMFVLSSVSVILQVAYYKLTKKRIFLMAPLHHHFEKKGVHEVRIAVCYSAITLLVAVLVVLLEIL